MPSKRRTVPTKMPALTVDTSPQSQSQSQTSPPHSTQSASPVRPPVSPITPTLGPAQLATSSNPSPNNHASSSAPRPQYTHTQPNQIGIPQPPVQKITLDENTDALALKSAMSILQLQARNAENDMRTLVKLKERALRDPEGYAQALERGEVKTKPGSLFNPVADDADVDDDEDEDEDEDEEMLYGDGDAISPEEKARRAEPEKEKKWGKIPTPQNIVRCPPINWQKYGVVGEVLDKMHEEQKARPTEGLPQMVNPDGTVRYRGDAMTSPSGLGIAAPFRPTRDKVEKMSTRRGGRR